MTTLSQQPATTTKVGQDSLDARTILAEMDQVNVHTPQQEENPYPLLSKATILLVDDCRTARLAVSRQLRSFGAEVEEAEDGRAALAMLRTAGYNDVSYDLIITDLNMPVMGGIGLLQAVRIDTGLHHIPIIVISSESEDASVLRCAKMGISSYMVKPPDPNKLAKTIEEALSRSNYNKTSSESVITDQSKCQLLDTVRKAARVANGLGESTIEDPDENRIVQAVKRWLEMI